MKKIEILLFVVTAFAIHMKFTVYTGGDELIMLSLTLLAVFYFALGFLLFNNVRLLRVFKSESYKDITALKVTGAIGLGIALSQICIGIVFKVLDLPGADEMLLIGIPFVSIIFVVALVKYIQTKNTRYYAPLVIRIFIFGSIGVLMLRTSNLTIVKLQYRDELAK